MAWGRTQFDEGELGEARKSIEQSMQLLPHEAVIRLELARILVAQSKYGEAEWILKAAVDLQTAGADVPKELSNLFAMQRDFEAAEHWKKQAELFQSKSIPVNDPWLHEILLLHQRFRGKLERAREFAKRGQFSVAATICRQILETDPDSIHATILLGACLTDSGQWAVALPLLIAGSQAHPKVAEVWAVLGSAQCAGLNWSDGEAAYRESLAIEPNAPLVSYQLGLALIQLHKLEEAADRIRFYTLSKPETGAPYFDLGVVLHQLKKPREAVEALEAGIQITPDQLPARLTLSVILTTLGEHEPADKHIQHAERLEPENPMVLLVRQRWLDATRETQ